MHNDIVIRIENLYKEYRLGTINHGMLHKDLQSWWARMRGKEDPNSRISHSSPLTSNVSLGEDRFWALQDVSLDVKRGEVVGIIGRNGAGKSTLLKILSQVTAPTKGQVKIKGRIASLLEVGTGFHPELTGRENIYLNGAILGMKKKEIGQKFDEIVAFAEIEKFIDTPVKRYSSGMYVRLAFAVAAHLEPEILVVDEVLAVGDIEFQKKCVGKMGDIAKEGRTVLFVSHNIGAVQRLCTRAVLLDKGSLLNDGLVQDIVSQYMMFGINQVGERKWNNIEDAPGDNIAKLIAVRAKDHNGLTKSKFTVRDSWYLETEFIVLKEGCDVRVNLFFYDDLGTLLFVAGDFQSEVWINKKRPIGLHCSRCLIPGDLLNNCTLRLLVGLVTPPSTLRAIEDNVIFVNIIDDASAEGARGYYDAQWPGGSFRPKLKWEFEYEPLGVDTIDKLNEI